MKPYDVTPHSEPHTSRLSDEQLATFDDEHLTGKRWDAVASCIAADFPGGRFSFLDLGGGNGRFTDRVLAAYPAATGTVFDASELLLSKNAAHPRKRVLLGDAMQIDRHCQNVDVVFCNWLLHHLVETNSYGASRRNIAGVLRLIRKCLAPKGRFSVFETNYNGYIDAFPGRAVFALTSSRLLSSLTRRLGANTAGVGVCFLSHKQWSRTFADAGFDVAKYYADHNWSWPLHRHAALLLKNVRHAHYWLSPA